MAERASQEGRVELAVGSEQVDLPRLAAVPASRGKETRGGAAMAALARARRAPAALARAQHPQRTSYWAQSH